VKESLIHFDVPVVTYDQAAVVAQPGEGAFDFPALAVAPQFPPIVERRLFAALPMRHNQQNASLVQSPTQPVAVVTPVGNDAQRTLSRSATPLRHRNPPQRALGRGHFRRAGRGQLTSQRYTLAVDHHHPLRTFAAFGFADALAPFLAGAKLPSRNVSSQSSLLRWSSSERKARQRRNQTSCSSHKRRRFQQTLELTPNSFGRSRQRAPLRSTHRMPSKIFRSALGGRPRRRRLLLGKSGSICFHCASVSNGFGIPSFSHNRCKGARENTYNITNKKTASRTSWADGNVRDKPPSTKQPYGGRG